MACSVVVVSAVLFASACSEENDGDQSTMNITPVPTEPVPAPPPEKSVPLNPMDAWCESMMAKTNQEWTEDEAKKFSRQCLHNDIPIEDR